MLERVVVYGSAGSGKSTFAAEAARRLSVPHVELDTLAFDSRLTHVAMDVLRQRFADATASGRWVVEGAHRDELGLALADAQLFVWLDPPRRVVVWRVLRRAVTVLVARQRRHGRRVTLRSFVTVELPFVAKTWRKYERRRVHAQGFLWEAERLGVRTEVVRSRAGASGLLQRLAGADR